MKQWFVGVVTLFIAACGAETMPDSTPETIADAIAAGATVIDVRTAEEMAEGMLTGAVPILYTEIVAGVEALNIPADTTLVLYCRSGRRSGVATSALQAAGYRNAINGGGYTELAAALAERQPG